MATGIVSIGAQRLDVVVLPVVLTLVAGACVLGVQMILIAHSYAIATGWRYGFRRLPLTYDPLYWPRPSA